MKVIGSVRWGKLGLFATFQRIYQFFSHFSMVLVEIETYTVTQIVRTHYPLEQAPKLCQAASKPSKLKDIFF